MKVRCIYVGCSPALGYYYYNILCENGHADYIWEKEYFKPGEYEMKDELWDEVSGWADLQCNNCGSEYRERVYPGMVVVCPVCSEPEIIPEEAILEESNLCDSM